MAKKQSSAKLSTLAATVMRVLDGKRAREWLTLRQGSIALGVCSVAELRSLCASVLSQDETRGQAKRKRVRGKR